MQQREEDIWYNNCVANDAGICDWKVYCGDEEKKWCKAAMKRYQCSQRQKTNNTTRTADTNDNEDSASAS